MARTLSERMRAHEQQKAKLAEAEARLKLDERRQRTRRLVEAGALVEKTGLLDLDSKRPLWRAALPPRWCPTTRPRSRSGPLWADRTFDREAKARDEGKEPLLLTFPAPLAKDATTALRKAGFPLQQGHAALGGLGPLRRGQHPRQGAWRYGPPRWAARRGLAGRIEDGGGRGVIQRAGYDLLRIGSPLRRPALARCGCSGGPGRSRTPSGATPCSSAPPMSAASPRGRWIGTSICSGAPGPSPRCSARPC